MDRPRAPRGCAAQVGRCCRRRSVLPPAGGLSSTLTRDRAGSRDVELAFMGLIPQKFTATQLLYRTTDRNGVPEAAVTTVMVPTERGPRAGLSGLLSYQCAIDAGRLALLPVVCTAARCVRGGRAAAIRAPADHRGRWRKAGRCRSRTMRAPRASGARPTNPAIASSTGPRCAGSRTHEPVAVGADRTVGIFGRRPGVGVGRRGGRRLRARARHRGRGAGLTRRRPGPHLPPAQRHVLLRPARAWWLRRSATHTRSWTA